MSDGRLDSHFSGSSSSSRLSTCPIAPLWGHQRTPDWGRGSGPASAVRVARSLPLFPGPQPPTPLHKRFCCCPGDGGWWRHDGAAEMGVKAEPADRWFRAGDRFSAYWISMVFLRFGGFFVVVVVADWRGSQMFRGRDKGDDCRIVGGLEFSWKRWDGFENE